jgi:hypothetical protein
VRCVCVVIVARTCDRVARTQQAEKEAAKAAKANADEELSETKKAAKAAEVGVGVDGGVLMCVRACRPRKRRLTSRRPS